MLFEPSHSLTHYRHWVLFFFFYFFCFVFSSLLPFSFVFLFVGFLSFFFSFLFVVVVLLLLLGFFFLLFFLRVWGDSRFFWAEFLCFWNHQYASLCFVGEEKQWVSGAKGGCILVACRSCIFEELLKKRKWIGFREEERSLTKTSSCQVSERERERERERESSMVLREKGVHHLVFRSFEEKRGKRKSFGSKSVKASLVHMTAALKKVRAFVL